MRLNKIEIKNFKCFENESIALHPELNVLMGNNGTGKTSLLEAFRILIGSLYLAFDKYKEKIEMPGIKVKTFKKEKKTSFFDLVTGNAKNLSDAFVAGKLGLPIEIVNQMNDNKIEPKYLVPGF